MVGRTKRVEKAKSKEYSVGGSVFSKVFRSRVSAERVRATLLMNQATSGSNISDDSAKVEDNVVKPLSKVSVQIPIQL